MRVLVIGQCTLQNGRLEYGNVGNYYIIEPLFRGLHQAFPNAEIVTTFQMTDDFCKREKISCLPIDLYYSWSTNNLDIVLKEYAIASIYKETREFIATSPYIEEVMKSDLVIDFSGDIWGENANILGKDRFLVGLLKDRIVQLLGRPSAMIAGSPGPFEMNTVPFASQVLKNFDLVTNREQISNDVLKKYGLYTKNIANAACPAFLFEPAVTPEIETLIKNLRQEKKERPIVGFILCGWNFEDGPFSKWPRSENEYSNFFETIEYVEKKLGAKVYLLSHSNGFEIEPEFKLIKGRDYAVSQQLYEIVNNRNIAKEVVLLDGIYLPAQTKAIINEFDMLISGRVHAAVAGWSQYVPTVVLDYGHEPKAHKLKGFAKMVGFENLVANPLCIEDIKSKVNICWEERQLIRKKLKEEMPNIKNKAKLNFKLLKDLVAKQSSIS